MSPEYAVESFRVCLPDVPEQRRIAKKLSAAMKAADAAITAARETLETVGAIRASLLRKAFAGEL